MFVNSCSSFILQLMKRAYLRVLNGSVHYRMLIMYLCEQEKRRPASMQISLFISTRVHQWSGGTDGRTDTVLIGRSLSTGSATCSSSILQKKHAMP